MKQYSIFNGTRIVEVDEKIVEIFESLQGPLTNLYIEIIAIEDSLDENISQEIFNKTITEALIDEIKVVNEIRNNPSPLRKIADDYDKEMEKDDSTR